MKIRFTRNIDSCSHSVFQQRLRSTRSRQSSVWRKRMTVLRGTRTMNRIVLAVFLLSSGLALSTQAHEDQGCNALFVIRAQSVSFNGSRLVLSGTDPNITYFCDRPVRTAGHMTIDAMREIVTRGENNFLQNPPNAAVSIFGADGDITDVVVVLPSAPKVTGDVFDFEVRVLEGKLPATGGAVVLFVDPVGVPVSPTSVAGVHRRHVRRAVRR